MAAWTHAERVEAPAIPRPRPRPRRASATPRRRLAGGVVWIAVLAVLLVGVVALNVAVLRLNMQIEKLGQQRLQLEAENALLESKVSSTLAPARIEQKARNDLGLVPAADPAYVELRRDR
ncbi:MAG TPA: cell division protein FtsL [Gaiellaceae bacterium]|nr:cell division protein FtsL [Gaiellaceae bacterium]